MVTITEDDIETLKDIATGFTGLKFHPEIRALCRRAAEVLDKTIRENVGLRKNEEHADLVVAVGLEMLDRWKTASNRADAAEQQAMLLEKGWESFARQLGLNPETASRDELNEAIAVTVLKKAAAEQKLRKIREWANSGNPVAQVAHVAIMELLNPE